jgi:hypothetical protein
MASTLAVADSWNCIGNGVKDYFEPALDTFGVFVVRKGALQIEIDVLDLALISTLLERS